MEQRLDLDLSADPSEAKRLRNELRRWLLQAGINGETGHDVTLAVVEAFDNAVRHPVERLSPRVRVHGEIRERNIALTVVDDGHWRKPDRGRDTGGLGLVLMKAFMTNVHIDRRPRGTRVTLQMALDKVARVENREQAGFSRPSASLASDTGLRRVPMDR